MTPDLLRELVAEASLSPNVHNIQPTLWRMVDANTVALVQSPTRRLPVGDPRGRDAAASHGAAAEGMIIAASARGIGLSLTVPESNEVARLGVTGTTAPDPLAPYLKQRRTYRGHFDKTAKTQARAAVQALSRPDIRILSDDTDIARIARLTDQATMRAFRNRAYREELTSWMRLTSRHPDWHRDGLNAKAMNMPTPMALAAGAVLSWPLFEILDALKLAGPLTAEAAATQSAAALIAFVQDRDADPFQTGRDWHRMWLELTALGLSAGVLTILGDDAEAAADMAKRLQLSPDQRVVTVLRVGMVDAQRLPPPARLPVNELILP